MILFERIGLSVFPIDFSEAAEFVNHHHRHCKAPVGHIFSLACYYDGRLVGVAMCGRPECVFPDPPKRGRKKIVKAETEL